MNTASAPNVLVALLGGLVAHLGCFGSAIDTPNFDRLAARDAIQQLPHDRSRFALSGVPVDRPQPPRRRHARRVELRRAFPMRGRIDPAAAAIAEVAAGRMAGVLCGQVALGPDAEASAAGHSAVAGAADFDRFYGFMQGETDHFIRLSPVYMVEQPTSAEDGYHLTEDLVDQAIDLIRTITPWCPSVRSSSTCRLVRPALPSGAGRLSRQYRGRFDEGWDVWQERTHQRQLEMNIIPEEPNSHRPIPVWAVERPRRLRACLRLPTQRGVPPVLDHTDAQLGRLLGTLDELDLAGYARRRNRRQRGISGRQRHRRSRRVPSLQRNGRGHVERRRPPRDIGTRRSFTNYPWGWAQVGNTLGKAVQQNTHGGGVGIHSSSWPTGISAEVQDRSGTSSTTSPISPRPFLRRAISKCPSR